MEGFFATLTRRRLKHGVFHSVVDLQTAINRFVDEHNQNPKPFVWRADPDHIIAAPLTSGSKHWSQSTSMRCGCSRKLTEQLAAQKRSIDLRQATKLSHQNVFIVARSSEQSNA